MSLSIQPSTTFTSIAQRALAIGLPLSAVALFLLVDPHDAHTKADVIGFAACHRIAERSLSIGGIQLPLCARCTGIYIGMITGWTWLAARGRMRAAQFPPRAIALMLIGFVALMGIDGLNSLAMLIPGAPHLYDTQNWMRLFTGSLYGVAVSALLTPMINVSLWREPGGDSALENWREAALIAGVAIALAMLALTQADFLLWPLTAVSVIGAVGLMAVLNTSIVAIAIGRVNAYTGWRELFTPGLAGIGLALTELVVIAALRANFPAIPG